MKLLAILVCTFQFAELASQVYHFERFGVEDGLSSSFVTDLAVDTRGYLWVATWGGGIMRFDGAVFEPINLCGSSRFFSSLAVDEDLRIWIGGPKELIRWDPRSKVCKVIRLEADVTDLALGSGSSLIVATRRGLFAVDKEELSVSKELLKGIHVYNLVQSGDDVYAGTHRGLFQVIGNSWQATIVDTTLSVVSAVSIDPEGNLWEAGPQGIKALAAISAVSPSRGDRPIDPTFVTAGSLGSLFIGTQSEGIFIWQSLDSSWQQITESQLGFDHVKQMIFDDWGNAWIATFGGGLIRYGTQAIRWHSAETGLQGRFVQTVRPRANSGVQILYGNGKVDHLDNGQIVAHANDWVSNQRYTALPVSAKTGSWLATEKGLLKYWQNAVYLVSSDTSWKHPITDFVEIDSTTLLLCAGDGLWRVHAERRETDSLGLNFSIERLLSNPFGHIYQDRNANLWCWSTDHLVLLSDTVNHIDLSSRGTVVHPTTIAETAGGEILIGSRESGIFVISRVENKMYVEPVQGSEKLPIRQIRSILTDDDRIWVGTTGGIAVGQMRPGPVFHLETWLDRSTGLVNPEINEHAGTITANRHVYFGTSSGLLEFYPTTGTETFRGPRLSLESIALNNKEYALANQSTLIFAGSKIRLSFNTKAIDQGLPLGIKYYWRLKGYQKEWQLSTTAGSIDLLSMPYGSFTMEIKAANLEGIESNTVLVPLQIKPPVWRRTWFAVASVLVLLFGLYALYRIRMNQLLKQSTRKARDLELQNDLLRLEQQALRLQMNPHFLFNALQSIQFQMREGRAEEAEKHLGKFGKLMRSLLDQSRRGSISLEDEIDGLRSYLDVEQSIRSGRFKFSISAPLDLDLSFYHIPTMMIQPFVENAVKHGLPAKGTPGYIQIEIRLKGKYLECIIEDNGPGWSQIKQPGHRSAGLRITSDRLRSMVPSDQINPVQIQVLEEAGEKTGTKVTLLIPLIDEVV